MSQIARKFPDEPERWNPFAGMPKAKPLSEVLKELGHAEKAAKDIARAQDTASEMKSDEQD